MAVHATELETASLAVHAGADILVHSVDDPVSPDFVRLLKERPVVYTTTISVIEGYSKVLGRKANAY